MGNIKDQCFFVNFKGLPSAGALDGFQDRSGSGQVDRKFFVKYFGRIGGNGRIPSLKRSDEVGFREFFSIGKTLANRVESAVFLVCNSAYYRLGFLAQFTDKYGFSRFNDTGLFQRNLFNRISKQLCVVKTYGSYDRKLGLDDVCGVQATTETCLQYGKIDFGLCKVNFGADDETQSLVGSPEYLSPEILSDEPYG